MNLISTLFLLVAFPISLLAYWVLFRQAGQKLWFLCLISLLFYALGGLQFVPVLVGLSLATLWLAHRRRFAVGIVLNLLVLGLFKYWDFGAENLNALADRTGLADALPLFSLALPLGISFYVFKHLGYLLDVQQGRYPASRDLLAFITYSAFFPQINAGPISGFNDTGAQLRALPATLTADQVYEGMIHISMGLAKKLLIADTLSLALKTTLFGPQQGGLIWAWSSVFLFALQLYFDFSGYTDLVIGIAAWFGIRLPPNFDNPYLASNPSQFWQRWHISLSLWFRAYLFTPLSRRLIKQWGMDHAERAQYTANLVTMLLVGLWHGAGWGFILWGGYHGLLLNVTAWANRRKDKFKIPAPPGLMFAAILVGWALFLSPDLAFARDLLSNLSGLKGAGSVHEVFSRYDLTVQITLITASIMVLLGVTEAANLPRIRRPAYLIGWGVVAALSIMHLERSIDFLYVQF